MENLGSRKYAKYFVVKIMMQSYAMCSDLGMETRYRTDLKANESDIFIDFSFHFHLKTNSSVYLCCLTVSGISVTNRQYFVAMLDKFHQSLAHEIGLAYSIIHLTVLAKAQENRIYCHLIDSHEAV